MIEINLLPDELKLRTKKETKALDARKILYFIPLVFAVLLIAHIYLAGILIFRNYQLNTLSHKWREFEPQRKSMEEFQKGTSQLSGNIQQLAAKQVNWSDKLSRLILYLPSGVWFNELSFSAGKDFILKGSVVSLQKEEIVLINKFMASLRTDADFFKDFSKLELSSVQRRKIGGYDIIDFVLTGGLK